LFFDKKNGLLKAESGILLADILDIIVPHGFFLPVTPGTKWISLGGAVASNIHGKNHHKEGGIANYIVSFELINESGESIFCSRTENTALFSETIGGMGLTGIISSITLQLKTIETSFIQQKSIKAKNLEELLDLFEQHHHFTYSVAWIDCLKKGKNLGRSILMLGEHATKNELSSNQKIALKLHPNKTINIPFYFPNFSLNRYSIQLFNALYYNKQWDKEKNSLVHYDSFFYPLDKINNWNKIYGNNGFTQYQLVIPFERGREGLKEIIHTISQSGIGSFLAVLKTFGKKDEFASSLSFPMEGYTLALDFKISPEVFSLLDQLDKIVSAYNGKLYLTKDARMPKAMFEKCYPNFKAFTHKFISLQTERLCQL